jgi:hypothetical protein
MAQIKQVGIGRKSTGTIDGITYYTLNGKTYARRTPTMPASVFNTTEARIVSVRILSPQSLHPQCE